jgi:hypothetical protein
LRTSRGTKADDHNHGHPPLFLLVAATLDDRALHVDHSATTSEFVGVALMKRIVGKHLAVLLVGRERHKIDQPIGDVVGTGIVCRQPIANDLAASIADRLKLVLDIVLEVLQPIWVERVTNAKCVDGSPSSEITGVHVWLRPERDLKDHRLPPCHLHALDDIGGMAAFFQVRPHRRDRGSGKADHVAATDVDGGVRVVGDVLLLPMWRRPISY